ncbi:MAG: ABC transporter ATP-binding protein [Nitrososphaeraceae archaeon]
MNNSLLSVIDLNKTFFINDQSFKSFGFRKKSRIKVVDNINFKLHHGEILVVAGESGSGKTTLARLIIRSLNPDSGKIIFDNEDITNIKCNDLLKIRSKMQMILQDPYSSLDPRMKVFDIIKEPLQVHNKGLNKKEIKQAIYSALSKVNLEPFEEISDKYPHMLSGGQRQRVSFARSLVLQPKLIIADEPVSMLDVSVRFQILSLMKKLKEIENISFIYITHDLSTSRYVGDNIIILYKGQIIEHGNIGEVIDNPLHPYTKALISAIPKMGYSGFKIIKVKNEFDQSSNSQGCKFLNKCIYAIDKCKQVEPDLTLDDKNHHVRCFNYKT